MEIDASRQLCRVAPAVQALAFFEFTIVSSLLHPARWLLLILHNSLSGHHNIRIASTTRSNQQCHVICPSCHELPVWIAEHLCIEVRLVGFEELSYFSGDKWSVMVVERRSGWQWGLQVGSLLHE